MIDNVDDELERREQAAEQTATAQERIHLQGAVALGTEVNRFLHGPLCARMESDARQQRAALLDELVDLDPDDAEDRKRIREIRVTVAALEQWKRFFEEYVESGNNAAQVLEEHAQT